MSELQKYVDLTLPIANRVSPKLSFADGWLALEESSGTEWYTNRLTEVCAELRR